VQVCAPIPEYSGESDTDPKLVPRYNSLINCELRDPRCTRPFVPGPKCRHCHGQRRSACDPRDPHCGDPNRRCVACPSSRMFCDYLNPSCRNPAKPAELREAQRFRSSPNYLYAQQLGAPGQSRTANTGSQNIAPSYTQVQRSPTPSPIQPQPRPAPAPAPAAAPFDVNAEYERAKKAGFQTSRPMKNPLLSVFRDSQGRRVPRPEDEDKE